MLKNLSANPLRVALAVSCIVISACSGNSGDENLSESVDGGSGDLTQGAANEIPDSIDGSGGNSDADNNSEDSGDSNTSDNTDDTDAGDGADNSDDTDDSEPTDTSGDDNVDMTDATDNSGDTNNTDSSGISDGTDTSEATGGDSESGDTTGDADTNSGSEGDAPAQGNTDSGSDTDQSTDGGDATTGGGTDASGSDDSELTSEFAGEAVITPSESDPFSKFQLEDALFTNNVYDGRQLDASNNWKLIFYDGVQDFVRWEVPAEGAANASPCVQSQADHPVVLSYRLTSRKDSPTEKNTFVRSYPAMVVGTMGGRYESWGVECGALQTILPSVQRHGGSPVYQMETVADVTGLPVLAGDLDYDIRVSVKADLLAEQASTGIANVFMDSYWHNVSDVALVPGGSPELVDTINGISSDITEVWNLNIWFDYPRFEGRASSWTGGFKIGTVTLQEGGDFDVYFKIEGSRDGHIPRCVTGELDNCFLYIGLVANDADASRNGVTINYTEIAEWMRSADFRDLFLTGAFESDTPSAKAYESWRLIDGTDNDNNPDPAKRGPRFPDQQHVIGGIHLGSELWYNPDAEPASIVFETLGVEVEGKGQFGRYTNY